MSRHWRYVISLCLALSWLVILPGAILAASAPTVGTDTADNILRTTATLDGTITSNGNSTVTVRGFQYGLSKTATWDAHETGSFGTGGYSAAIMGLSAATTYWFRAYATNTAGTGYGSWVSFTTKDYPSITTMDASSIAGTSARLNSGVVSDGNDNCTITFGWGLTSAASVGAYDSYQTVSGTFNTGDYPYLDVTGLLTGHTYYFRVLITNAIGTRAGNELIFETILALLPPDNFIGYPEATLVSLSWNKGAGSSNTMVRYGQTNYPALPTDGDEVYFGPSSAYTLTGLVSGKTYYIAAWGETGGNYSMTSTTLLMTTSATSSTTTPDMEVPAQPTWWFTTDYTSMSNLGLIYDSINAVMDVSELPRATGWFLLAIVLAFIAGLLGYLFLGKKLMIAMICMTVVMALEYFAHQVPWWVPLVALILVIAFSRAHQAVNEG